MGRDQAAQMGGTFSYKTPSKEACLTVLETRLEA